MAINQDAIESAVRNAVAVASGLALTKVIIPRQDAPRPEKPYATVDVQTTVTPFTDDRSKVQSTEYTLTVQSTAVGFLHVLKIGDEVFEYTSILADTPAMVAGQFISQVNGAAIGVTAASVAGAQYTLTSDDPDIVIFVEADEKQSIDSGDAEQSNLEMQITVSLQFYGNTSYDLAAATKHRLQLQSSIDALTVGGVTLFRTLDVLSAPELTEESWEERHVLDILIGVVSSETDETGTIETVDGIGTVTPDGGSPVTVEFDASAID